MHSFRGARPVIQLIQPFVRAVVPVVSDVNVTICSRNMSSINHILTIRRPAMSKSIHRSMVYQQPIKTNNFISIARQKSNAVSKPPKDILLSTNKNGVTTLTMNQPKKLNGWTGPMMMALKDALSEAAKDDNTKVAILTGADPYYCAGVNLSDTIKPMHPATLHKMIMESNAAIFNVFIDFPKPLIIAANGPAIGACFTSATLCDFIMASEKATFCTPFARLGVPPEGCSSVHFERIMGKDNANRMLGPEGWIPTAAEAKEAGFVKEVVAHENLLPRAQEVAEKV